MRGLAIKRDADGDAVGARHEIDLGVAVAEGICDPLVLDDLRIDAGKVEAHAAVLRFHAGREGAAFTQVDRRPGRMPVVRRGVPLRDIGGARVGPPDVLYRSLDDGFDSNLHGARILSLCGSLRGRMSPAKTDTRNHEWAARVNFDR